MKCAPATKGEKRYCRLCSKKETRNQCAYGGRMWDRYAVKDATKEETEAAAEESGITNGSSEGGEGGMSEHWIDKFEKGILEANKSGDSSLRDWFSKSRSSDGKPGWVQLGGKYAGKPCAKQPGQTTKPKCGSSKMKKNLNKDEEDSAFRRKQKQDPNPNRKGKAINVKTESTQIHEGEKDACYTKVKSRYSVWPSAYASGALVKCRKVGAKNWGNKSKKEEFEGLKSFSEFQSECWKTHKKVGMKMKGGKLVPDCRPKNEEKEYTGPDKEDRKVIKKSDNKDFASKLADYEKNMDPKKRQALKDKATKGMKFTHEKNQERTPKEDLTKKDESLTKRKIQDLTLKHQAKRLEIPGGHPSALE